MQYFPIPYPDELLYSTIARAGIRLGITSPKQLLDVIFQNRCVMATLDLPRQVSTIERLLPDGYSSESLIYQHTLFPLYAPFILESRRKQCLTWMSEPTVVGRQNSVHMMVGMVASRLKTPSSIRYCPACVQSQKEKYGEYFWLREWQVNGIDACPEHGVLINTTITRPLKERHHFIAASPLVCMPLKQEQKPTVSDWVTAQVRLLLTRQPSISPTLQQWSSYYRLLAQEHGYMRGHEQIDQGAIHEKIMATWPKDWLNVYQLEPSCDDSSDWVRSIFRKHRKSFSYLQHIVIHQALFQQQWNINEVLSRVGAMSSSLRRHHLVKKLINDTALSCDQQTWLDLVSTSSPTVVRTKNSALYARLYRAHREWLLKINSEHPMKKTPGTKDRLDWELRDKQYLGLLEQYHLFAVSNDQGPRRSRAFYLKGLMSPSRVEKNLHRLPRVDAFISIHVESISQYQIRRLRNIFVQLQFAYDGKPPRWRLLRNSGLSEERLTKDAYQFLQGLLDGESEVTNHQRCER
jgi:hypothetical protein